jgi:hypothetical protein
MNPTSPANPATQALRSLFWQLGLSIAAYMMAIFAIGNLVPVHALANPGRTIVVLLPVIPMLFAFAAFVRFVRATDELKRLIIVYSFAIAGGVNIFFTVIWSLLAIAGIPNPSALCCFSVFIGSQLIAGILLHRHYYHRCG